MLRKMLPLSAACLVLGATAASAANLFPYQNTVFEDSAVDFFTLDDGNSTPLPIPGNGLIDVGDVLTAVVEVERLVDGSGVGPAIEVSSLGVELTGLAIIQVVSKTGGPGAWHIEFGPAAASLWPASVAGVATANPGAIMALWEGQGSSNNLNLGNCPNFAACTAAAVDGTLFQVDGSPALGETDYDADNQWFFNGTSDDAAVALTISQTSVFGLANFAMSNLYQVGPWVIDEGANSVSCLLGFTCAGDGLADLVGSTDTKGGRGLTNGGFAGANFTFNKIALPEPGTLALFGLGALGLGSIRRRNRKA